MAAADVGDLGARPELLHDAVQRWQPSLNQVGGIAGAEEAIGRAEAARRLLAPWPAFSRLERVDGFLMRLVLGDDGLKEALQARRLTFAGEDFAT